jgi:hypothetical protein
MGRCLVNGRAVRIFVFVATDGASGTDPRDKRARETVLSELVSHWESLS